jgi:TP901 family phage tail tape measure protein
MASKRTEYEIAMLIGGKVSESFGNSVNSVNSGFERMAGMAKTAAKMAAAAFGAVKIGQFVGDAIETYQEFEQSMANTAAIANATQAQYEQLESAAREMGKETTKTASEAADALGYMMLAGWSVDKAISGLEPVLRLSEATQMDLARTSDLVTDSMSALGVEVDGLSNYLDVCVVANNRANTTAEALMEAYIGVGGMMKSLNVPIQESAAALGVMANRGIKGSEAGNALNAVMINLTTGAGAAGKVMKKIGVSAFDSRGSFIGLQETLLKVNAAMENMTEKERNTTMAAIGGKTHVADLGALMSGLTTQVASGATEWNELQEALYDSDGALTKMADTITNTLSAAFLRLESAVDDAKISFADAFSDDLKDAVNSLSGFIPTLTEKFIEFATKAGPKISKTFQSIRKGASEAWTVLSGVGGWAIENFDTIKSVIIGVGAALAAYKIGNALLSIGSALKSIIPITKALITGNPIGILLGVASAIVGIVAAVKAAEKAAVRSNLAEHFGDIALSMNEIREVASHIVQNDDLSKVQQALAEFAKLGGIQQSMKSSIDAINKMNWKVSIGMELSSDDKDSYIAEIENYVTQAQNYVEQTQYAINLDLSLFADGDLERQNIVDQLNTFYSGKYAELESLGTKLNETVTNAFSDGLLELDEIKEITDIQAQMARIQESIATSDFEAKLKVMELQFDGGNLTAESFQALQEEIAEQTKATAAQYEESLTLRIANYNVMLEDGAINQAQYDKAVSEFWEDYLSKTTAIEAKALNFQTDTIMNRYSEELGPAIEGYMQKIDDVVAGYGGADNDWNWTYGNISGMFMGMLQALETNDLDKTTQEALKTLLESMRPSIERMGELKGKYEELGAVLPEALTTGLTDAKVLSALTKDAESIYYVVGQSMGDNEYFKSTIPKLIEQGKYIPEALAEGMESSTKETIAPVIDGMYAYSDKYLKEVFARDLNVSANVNVRLNPLYSQFGGTTPPNTWGNGKLPGLGGHAEGGIFDTPHVAWFAEKGPEAAIPLDGSSNAISIWERVGRLLGVFDNGIKSSQGESLYNGITNNTTNNTTNDTSDESKFTFAPNITIEGNANREDIDSALHDSFEEFKEYMERYKAEQSRVSFALN